MKKTKIKQRFENAVDAFFENEASFEDSRIVLNNNSFALAANYSEEETIKNIDSKISFAKLGFLFLPGSFFLFKVPMILGYVNAFLPHYISNYGTFDYYFVKFLQDNPVLGIFFSVAACFMTYIGFGSLRETKNLLVPALISSFSLLLLGIFSFLPEPLRADAVMYYSIYLFPLVLAAAGLVKYWIKEN